MTPDIHHGMEPVRPAAPFLGQMACIFDLKSTKM